MASAIYCQFKSKPESLVSSQPSNKNCKLRKKKTGLHITTEHSIRARVKLDVNAKAAIGMLMSASGTVFAQITIAQAPAQLSATNQPTINLTNTNQVLNVPLSPLSPPETPKPPKPSATPSGLAPGVYVTKPFSCMVMVPGPQADNCIIPATIPPHSIPNAKPRLKFKPAPPPDGI